MVESISPINARIFPEYILPCVREFATDQDVLVRTTYAGCIALLAETALRFLEMTQLLKSNNTYLLGEADAEELDFEVIVFMQRCPFFHTNIGFFSLHMIRLCKI